MLSQTAEYALRTALWLAGRPNESQTSPQIARGTRVPPKYLVKVLQALGRAGLVDSQPGPGGGYRFHGDPEAVTLLTVVEAIGPLPRIRSCPLGLRSHDALCPLHEHLDEAYAALERALAQVTLGELLRRPARVPPLVERADTAPRPGGRRA